MSANQAIYELAASDATPLDMREALDRLMRQVAPAARRFRRPVARFAIASATSAALVSLLVFSTLRPLTILDGGVVLVVLIVMLAPAGILFNAWQVLKAVGELPERVHALPDEAMAQFDALLDAMYQQAGREQFDLRAFARDLWRVGKLTLAAREHLAVLSPLIQLGQPSFLFVMLLAALAAVLEAIAALVAVAIVLL